MGKKRKRREKLSYAEYLRSARWRRVRDAFSALHPRVCAVCGGGDDLDLHHKSYKHIFRELDHLDDLSWLCRSCHATEHDKPVPEAKPVRRQRSQPAVKKRKGPKPRLRAGLQNPMSAQTKWRNQR